MASKPAWLERLSSSTQSQPLPKVLLALASIVLMVWSIPVMLEAWLVGKEQVEQARVLEARSLLSKDIESLVASTRKTVEASAKPEILALMMPGHADPSAFEQGRKLFLDSVKNLNVQLYRPDLSEMLAGDIETFGYSRGNALAEALASDTGQSRVQIYNPRTAQAQVAFAHTLQQDQLTTALAFVQLPIQTLQDLLNKHRSEGGELVFAQGENLGSTAEVLGIESKIDASKTGELLPVPGTRFWIGTRTADHFKPSMVFASLEGSSPKSLWAKGFGFLFAGIVLRLLRSWQYGRLGRLGSAKAGAGIDANEPVMGPMHQAPLAKAAAASRTIEDRGAVQSGVELSEDGESSASPAPVAAAKPSAKPTTLSEVDRSIFRAYDIRGIIGQTLLPDTAHSIGRAIGSAAVQKGLQQIVVARDGRLSGPTMVENLTAGLRAAGCDVIDIGAVPTPTLYFATYHLGTGSGVMVTGSHNPPDYNGFKIMLGSETLAEEQIQDLFGRIVEGRLAEGRGGVQQIDVKDDYVERITLDIQLGRKLKVVLDAGNGIGGELGVRILQGIGCEVVPLYCDTDGKFPNHHPDPSEPKNLKDLIFAVKQYSADIGLALDGDADRLGVVTPNGEIIWPDRVLALFARDVLARSPGASIIYDVKCSGRLNSDILAHGGLPIMWKTGHSLMKAKMREEDAALAGEMSGHFFFGERWYGFDDGIYSATRLCEILSNDARSADEIFADIPTGVTTPELKVPMAEGAHYEYIERFRERAKFPGAGLSLIDGVRADYPDGWGLVRCSNTTPCLVLRFEADNQATLNRIQATFKEQLLALDSSLKLPF